MGRPRRASDEDIFDAIAHVLSEGGPTSLTLSRVGDRAGISAAALVSRFGSKNEMLVAFTAAAITDEVSPAKIRMLAALESLRRILRSSLPKVASRSEMAARLALFELGSQGASSNSLVREQAKVLREAIRDLSERALAASQLEGCDPALLADALEAVWYGAQVSWALFGSGSLKSWVMARVDAVIEPYKVASPAEIPEPDGLLDELVASEERTRAGRGQPQR